MSSNDNGPRLPEDLSDGHDGRREAAWAALAGDAALRWAFCDGASWAVSDLEQQSRDQQEKYQQDAEELLLALREMEQAGSPVTKQQREALRNLRAQAERARRTARGYIVWRRVPELRYWRKNREAEAEVFSRVCDGFRKYLYDESNLDKLQGFDRTLGKLAPWFRPRVRDCFRSTRRAEEAHLVEPAHLFTGLIPEITEAEVEAAPDAGAADLLASLYEELDTADDLKGDAPAPDRPLPQGEWSEDRDRALCVRYAFRLALSERHWQFRLLFPYRVDSRDLTWSEIVEEIAETHGIRMTEETARWRWSKDGGPFLARVRELIARCDEEG